MGLTRIKISRRDKPGQWRRHFKRQFSRWLRYQAKQHLEDAPIKRVHHGYSR
jgi:hypothetical protein